LNQEKYFYEVLFDKYSLPLLLIDENGKILKANEPASKLYGYSKEEIQNIYIWTWRSAKREIGKIANKYIQGDLKRFEFIHISKSGKKINVEVYVNKLSMEDKTYILYTVFDISEKVLLAKLLDILKEINTILVSVELESELLNGIAETIIMFDFDYVEIFKVKQKDNLELMLKSGTPIEDISLEEKKSFA